MIEIRYANKSKTSNVERITDLYAGVDNCVILVPAGTMRKLYPNRKVFSYAEVLAGKLSDDTPAGFIVHHIMSGRATSNLMYYLGKYFPEVPVMIFEE